MPFLYTLQIQTCLPPAWKKILIKCTAMPKHIIRGNTINVNKQYKTLDTITCKDDYWHIINMKKHTPTSLSKWTALYQDFKSAECNVWKIIFRLHLKQQGIQKF